MAAAYGPPRHHRGRGCLPSSPAASRPPAWLVPVPAPLTSDTWSLLLPLSVAQLMVILDISAVNVALPDLAKDLNIGAADIGWTITATR
jgi:hypothetical protein